MNPISIGKPPFITEDLVDYLDEFLDLYKDRPIQDNGFDYSIVTGGHGTQILFRMTEEGQKKINNLVT